MEHQIRQAGAPATFETGSAHGPEQHVGCVEARPAKTRARPAAYKGLGEQPGVVATVLGSKLHCGEPRGERKRQRVEGGPQLQPVSLHAGQQRARPRTDHVQRRRLHL